MINYNEIRCADWHNHTEYSNLFSRDSINTPAGLINKALELNIEGIGFTEHGNLSSSVKAIKHLKKLREDAKKEYDNNPTQENLDILNKVNDFKIGLGSEIYLVDRSTIALAKEKNMPTRFYHFIVIAKNLEGFRALCKLSSLSWEESFYFRGMQRVPTYKDVFHEWLRENKGNVVCSTACLGSEFSKLVLEYNEENEKENKDFSKLTESINNINDFVRLYKSILGDDFYIEIQPSDNEEQISYNKTALKIAEGHGVKVILTNDVHYLTKEMRTIHSNYLKSQNAERETDSFYATTHLMTIEEKRSYLEYIDDDKFIEIMNNTIDIKNKIEDYDVYKITQVPNSTIELEAPRRLLSHNIKLFNNKRYVYIENFLESIHTSDKVLIQEIEKGIVDRKIGIDERVLSRIDEELKALWLISEKLGQRLSSYYVLTKEIVIDMWNVSLVGVSRGSAGAFYICYLLGITDIDALELELPSWRHISETRPELPDIDLDTEKGQRNAILENAKAKYGERRVLNITTFKTEGTSSAIQTMCRGLGVSTDNATYLSSIIVKDMSVKECLDNYNKKTDCTNLINEMMAINEELVENVIAIEGLVCGRGIHASGLYIFSDDYYEINARMNAPKGIPTTQFDMTDSDYMGGLKLDFLTIESLDKIRKCLDLLLKYNKIEWQGSIKETYDKYLSPNVLEYNNPDMWKLLYEGEVIDAFQFETVRGRETLIKVQPLTLQELISSNSLMRLTCEGIQPIERFVKYKENINLWYEEMQNHNLNHEEIDVLRSHLERQYGVATTQEDVMRLSMDNKIANFDLVMANKLRKAIAKSNAKDIIGEVKDKFIESGLKAGNRIEILNYVWDIQITPQLSYSFSEPHTSGYSLILLQEMNLCYKYTPLYWKVACLSVNSGAINEEVSKGTDYGAIAKAIGDMPKGFVLPPDINISDIEFTPLEDEGRAMYSLMAINGIGEELVRKIMELRPFNSFEDFLIRCIDTKVVTPAKGYQLIKAGCFDRMNPNRFELMMKYVTHVTESKTKLTTANVAKLVEYNLIPNELMHYVTLFNFRKLTFSKENCVEMYSKTQGLYKIPSIAIEYFNRCCYKAFEDAVEYDDNGNIALKSKEFDKKYKELITPLNEWLTTKEALDKFNNYLRKLNWDKYCSGSIAKWEMDSICYYTDKHELEEYPIEYYYPISNFSDLPREAEKVEVVNKAGRTIKQNKLSVIAGTVVDKNKLKNIVTLNTKAGIVELKLDKGRFAYYDRNTDDDKSWLTRGNKLVVIGFRRGEMFIPRVYSDSVYKHSIVRVAGIEDNKVKFKLERNFNIEE